MLLLNPVYYMVEAFRLCLLRDYTVSPAVAAGFGAWTVFAFAAGGLFFDKFKSAVADYE